ncbi:Fic family protein [uncultured Amnibacterium sp.]|uniref:Fic family protein n=1 Tax=uncultured Amnibacterium sp. TaxID=1631851 RepID=UPI0035CB0A3F
MPDGRGRPSRAAIFEQFAAATTELKALGGLPTPQEARPIWDSIWHSEVHNSTALEGNTLVLREVRVLLDEHRATGSKAVKDYLEVQGYGDAARWVYSQARGSDWSAAGELVTLSEIRHIHEVAMTPVWTVAPHPEAGGNEAPGGFREHDIHPFSGGMQPPPWVQVHPRLSTWVDEVNAVRAALVDGSVALADLPMRLANLHSAFERIHPFIDGNGRTGRLVLNLLLTRLGYPPAIVYKRSRDRYLKALDRADHGDVAPLAEVLARSVIGNLHELVLANIAGPARIVPLRALESDDLTYQALRQAASRGRLRAQRGSDGQWRSSRHDVEAYRASRYQRPRD